METALIFYVDEQLLLALANGILDYLLLWATAATTRVYSTGWRLGVGALFGTLYYVCYILSLYGLIPYYGLLGMWPTLLAVSLVMLLIVFAPLSLGQLRSVIGHFYLISFISAGMGLAGMYLLSTPGEPNQLLGIGIAIISLLLTAQLGWHALQRRSWRQGLQLHVDITVGTNTTRITALLDTGNQLQEPLLGTPVLIVEHAALANLLPDEVLELAEQAIYGDINAIYNTMQTFDYATRLCLIPFHSVGNQKGLMVGFRPDTLTLWLDSQAYQITRCTIALATHTLDSGRVYQGLIGPQLLEDAMSTPYQPHHEPASHMRKEESVHALTHK